MSRDTIRARVAAATEGPWWDVPDGERDPANIYDHVWGPDGDAVAQCYGSNLAPYDMAKATAETDATFIAHARQDIPALLDIADAVAKAAEWSGTGRARGASKVRVLYIDDWNAITDALAALEALP